MALISSNALTFGIRAFLSSVITGALLCSFTCRVSSPQHLSRDNTHVGIVFNVGGKDDNSYNAAAWEGAKRAQSEFHAMLLHDIEPGTPASVEPSIRAFAERDCNLIIGIGLIHKEVIERVAREYPYLHFVVVDSVVEESNVSSLVFSEQDGSYLVGIIAARKSRTDVIGFIGGMDIQLIHRFELGFAEGAHATNSNMKLLVNYIGVTDSAWNDPAKCREIALSQIDRGADVIFVAAGNSGLGAFDAVEVRAGTFVIGVDSNQNWIKPGHVLTSMVKRVDNAVYQIIRDEVQGRFLGGVHVFDLSNDGIAYAVDRYNVDLLEPSVISEVESAKRKIVAKEIIVSDPMKR